MSRPVSDETRRDRAYRQWIRNKRPTIPAEAVRPFAEAAINLHGGRKRLAHVSGVSTRLIQRIMNGPCNEVEYATGESIASVSGQLLKFSVAVPPPGKDDWSRLGRFCGDGAGVSLDGCGTFHHEHYLDGLCVECWQREVSGEYEGEPRDVRESRDKGNRVGGRVRGRTGVRKASSGNDSTGQLSLL